MNQLSYDVLKTQQYDGYILKDAPEKILQFGGGNFLRAFVNYFVDVLNEKTSFKSKVAIVQPIATGTADMINDQEGLYNLYLRGMENGKKTEEKRLISCVSRAINPYENFEALLECARNPELRYIISNTTEAGIVYDPNTTFDQKPQDSFPGKLTRVLYERFKTFGGEGKGIIILACELIDNNGIELKKCVEKYIDTWNLEKEFLDWVQKEVVFCSTLVDRIVTGYPRDEVDKLNQENGYIDSIMVTGELFGLWVIEGPQSIEEELPFKEAGLPVIVVPDHSPYKQRKVRILNGAHTSMSPTAFIAGKNTVGESLEDPIIKKFVEVSLANEIIPTLTLPVEELKEFADAVIERFQNPFIKHNLLSITLNCTSKWKVRVLPSLKGYYNKNNSLPKLLTLSFASLLDFYSPERLDGNNLVCKRGNEEYIVNDDLKAIEFFNEHKDDNIEDFVKASCSNADLWGEDLSAIPGFYETVLQDLKDIRKNGVLNTISDKIK